MFDVLTLLTIVWVLVAAGLLLSSRRKPSNAVMALLVLFVATPLLLSWGGVRWVLFVRVPAHVYIDQRNVQGARVYKGSGGRRLIAWNDSEMSLYLPEQNEVMLCDSYLFHDYGVAGRLEKGKDEYFCMSSEKEESIAPTRLRLDLQVQDGKIAFNIAPGGVLQRVTVVP